MDERNHVIQHPDSDSPAEGDGFEPHKKQPFLAAPVRSRNSPSATKTGSFVPGTDGSNPSPSSGESVANHFSRGGAERQAAPGRQPCTSAGILPPIEFLQPRLEPGDFRSVPAIQIPGRLTSRQARPALRDAPPRSRRRQKCHRLTAVHGKTAVTRRPPLTRLLLTASSSGWLP